MQRIVLHRKSNDATAKASSVTSEYPLHLFRPEYIRIHFSMSTEWRMGEMSLTCCPPPPPFFPPSFFAAGQGELVSRLDVMPKFDSLLQRVVKAQGCLLSEFVCWGRDCLRQKLYWKLKANGNVAGANVWGGAVLVLWLRYWMCITSTAKCFSWCISPSLLSLSLELQSGASIEVGYIYRATPEMELDVVVQRTTIQHSPLFFVN